MRPRARGSGSSGQWAQALPILLAAAASYGASPTPGLVAAIPSQANDLLGFLWDIGSAGEIEDGTNDCFDGGGLLVVGGAQFGCQEGLMTPDGREYFFTATMGNVEVTRRVKVDIQVGAVRYVEQFKNLASRAISLKLAVICILGSPCAEVVTDAGAGASLALDKQRCGIVAVSHLSSSSPSVLFFIGGRGSAVKPTLNNKGNKQLTFDYSLSIGPRATVSILHGMAQRNLAGAPDAKAAAALFKPFLSRAWIQDLPAVVQKTICNRGTGSDPRTPAATLKHADVLSLGEGTQLQGTASCSRLSVATGLGSVDLPLERIAVLIGGRSAPAVRLRDGQILPGAVAAEDLAFTLPSGSVIPLSIEGIDYLSLREGEGDGGAPPAGAITYLEVRDGARLAILQAPGEPDPSFRAWTAWGSRAILLAELLSIRPLEGAPGYRVVLEDGSRFCAFLDDAEVALATALFGVRKLRFPEIKSIVAAALDVEKEGDQREPADPHVVFSEDTIVTGRIDLPEIHFLTAAGVIPVAPAQLSALRNTSLEAGEDAGRESIFTGELWGVGAVSGYLEEAVVPFRTGGAVWQVPIGDILEYRVPAPRVSDAVRIRVAQLIRDLGHEEWERREAASKGLAEIGAPAKAQLEEARDQAKDAEVLRRVRLLLQEVKD